MGDRHDGHHGDDCAFCTAIEMGLLLVEPDAIDRAQREAAAREREAILAIVEGDKIPYLDHDNMRWAARNIRSGHNQAINRIARAIRQRGEGGRDAPEASSSGALNA